MENTKKDYAVAVCDGFNNSWNVIGGTDERFDNIKDAKELRNYHSRDGQCYKVVLIDSNNVDRICNESDIVVDQY